jgi:hypothetical protein
VWLLDNRHGRFGRWASQVRAPSPASLAGAQVVAGITDKECPPMIVSHNFPKGLVSRLLPVVFACLAFAGVTDASAQGKPETTPCRDNRSCRGGECVRDNPGDRFGRCVAITTTTMATTTTLPGPQICAITFRLDESAPLTVVQFDTDYSSAPGEFAGSLADVDCTDLVGASLFAARDVEADDLLTIGVILIGGFTGPRDLATCTFLATATPTATDFVTTDVIAENQGTPLEPEPTISVSSIQCTPAD